MEETKINEILKGYIEAVLFTEKNSDDGDENIFGGVDFTFENFTSDSIDKTINDIKQFLKDAGEVAVKEAVDLDGLYKLGINILLTRNGHGSGFFDYDYENESLLTDAADKLGEVYLDVNFDEKLILV